MNSLKNIFLPLLFIAYIFWSPLFFSISSIVGISNYDSDAPGYAEGILLTGFLSVFLIIAMGRGLFQSNKLFTIIFPCFMIIAYLFEMSISNIATTQFISYYVCFCIPASYIGVYVAKADGISKYTKWIDLVMLVITMGLVISIPQMAFNYAVTNVDISFGGSSYQQMAYMSGLAFTINLSGLLFGKYYERFKFMNRIYSRIICYILLIFQLIGCFYSGGRGGFIYLFICSALLLLYSKKIKYIFYIITFIFALYLIALFFSGSILSDIVIERMERTFSFISATGGIDTQNRGPVWNEANRLYSDSSFLGTGIFSYYGIFRSRFDQPYAHNIFWDFLLQGGILYLFLWVVIISKGILNLIKQLNLGYGNAPLIIIFLFPFITLCFSSTYLQSPLFWFVLSYLYAARTEHQI